jgi:hypothetical protein
MAPTFHRNDSCAQSHSFAFSPELDEAGPASCRGAVTANKWREVSAEGLSLFGGGLSGLHEVVQFLLLVDGPWTPRWR